jgi:hypothetical protein
MPRAKPRQSGSTAPPERLPDQVVEEQPTLEARLSVLNRAQLQALVRALAARQPNLGELIDEQLHVSGFAAAPSPSSKRSAAGAHRTTAAATTAIRRQARSLLRSYGHLVGVADGVRELAEQARPHIDAGDGNSALAILEVVTEAYVNGCGLNWTTSTMRQATCSMTSARCGAKPPCLPTSLQPTARRGPSVWPPGRQKPRSTASTLPSKLRPRMSATSRSEGRTRISSPGKAALTFASFSGIGPTR